MEWTENLRVGIDTIDEQHKELISRVNALYSALRKKNSRSETLKVLDFLSSYVVTHFKEEEAIQVQYHYPNYSKHKKMHEDFIQTMDGIRDEIAHKGTTDISSSLIAMTLSNWLVNHIGIQDRDIGKFIAQ
jgi:hemerythrin